MRRITFAESVERVYQKWHATGAGEWFAQHPDDLKLFNMALKAYTDGTS